MTANDPDQRITFNECYSTIVEISKILKMPLLEITYLIFEIIINETFFNIIHILEEKLSKTK